VWTSPKKTDRMKNVLLTSVSLFPLLGVWGGGSVLSRHTKFLFPFFSPLVEKSEEKNGVRPFRWRSRFGFIFRKRSFLSDFSTEEVQFPPPPLFKLEKSEKGQGETEWKGGGGGELLRCWKTPHDAVESSTVRNSHPRTPLSVTATALLLRAPRSHTHTHIYCIHTYIGVCVCVHLLPSVSHPQTHNVRLTATYFIFISFLFFLFFSLLFFFTNCLISPLLPV
jgi:hypothetical protein